MYSSRLNSRRACNGAVALRVPTEAQNASKGAHSKCVGGSEQEVQETCGPRSNEPEESQGTNEKEPEVEDDVTTQLGAALKDFEQVLPFSAFGRFFQQAKTQVMDVAQSPAVKFVGNVMTQITDATENMDQRMDQFLTGMVIPPETEGDENAVAGTPSQLPVSNPSAPVLERPSDPPHDVHPPQAVQDWGDFDFDDDSDIVDQPVTQQPDRHPQQRQENMICRKIDVGSVEDSAAVQRSPLHPHTPHTPTLGSPETMANTHMNQAENPLHDSLHALLRQDCKENALSQDELVERCTALAEQSLEFQQQCQTLIVENTRLKHVHEYEGDAVLAEQLAIQVQHLMQEKSRILQEKHWLEKENGNLQQLLDFACASMGRASSPGEGEADVSPAPACEEHATPVLNIS